MARRAQASSCSVCSLPRETDEKMSRRLVARAGSKAIVVEAKPVTTTEGSSSLLTIGLPVAAVLLFIIAAVVAFVVMKKRGST